MLVHEDLCVRITTYAVTAQGKSYALRACADCCVHTRTSPLHWLCFVGLIFLTIHLSMDFNRFGSVGFEVVVALGCFIHLWFSPAKLVIQRNKTELVILTSRRPGRIEEARQAIKTAIALERAMAAYPMEGLPYENEGFHWSSGATR